MNDNRRCKPCQRCGLRETISPCTRMRSTQCGACPRWHYQADFTIDSCKECSTCCEGKRYAELECIYLKQCKRRNCTKEMENKQNHSPKLIEIIRAFSKPGRATGVEPTKTSTSEDNLVHEKNLKLRREVNTTLQGAYPADATARAEEKSGIFQADDSNTHPTPTPPSNNYRATTRLSATIRKTQEGLYTVQEYHITTPATPLNASYVGGVKTLVNVITILVALILLMLSLIAVIMMWNSCKRNKSDPPQKRDYFKTCCVKYEQESEECEPVLHNSSSQSDEDSHEVSSNLQVDVTFLDSLINTTDLESIPLTNIPITIEDALVMKLDLCREGESVEGWQKVATEFGIDEIKYLENGYKRDSGSPTKELLEILASQGRNLADLVSVLKSQNVNYPDIALLVCELVRNQTR